MAAVLMLGLAACGGSGASAPASSAAGSASASSGASGQDSAGGTSVVEEIQEKGVLTMMTATGFRRDLVSCAICSNNFALAWK